MNVLIVQHTNTPNGEKGGDGGEYYLISYFCPAVPAGADVALKAKICNM